LDHVITERTLRQWIFHGKIASVRIGGAVCVPTEALDALIERGRVSA
jgi:excisionase family DNA binding protein